MGLRQSLTYHRIAHTGRFSKLKTVCRYESWFARKLNLKFSKSLGIYKTYTELLFEVNSAIVFLLSRNTIKTFFYFLN
jgi:hypothetical protein